MVGQGDVLTTERVFSAEDVAGFAALTGDRGRHHVQPDADGRLLVHGLLVASLPTQLGGEIHYIARTMEFEFLRPVYTGQRVRAELHILRADPAPGRLNVEMDVFVENEANERVIQAHSRGIIRRSD